MVKSEAKIVSHYFLNRDGAVDSLVVLYNNGRCIRAIMGSFVIEEWVWNPKESSGKPYTVKEIELNMESLNAVKF